MNQTGKRQPRGSAMIYGTVCAGLLLGITSLAVDLGRAQLTKTQLQNAVDAAARHASTGLADSTVVTKAQSVAAENLVDGTALTLQSGDIETGTWNSTTKTFTTTATNPNAVRITGRRSAARGNAMKLYFAGMFGRSSFDLTAQAIVCKSNTAPTFKFIALDGVNLGGTATINANTGETSGVSVASNGNWNMNTGTISGDVFYRNWAPTGGTITGSKIPMSTNLVCASPTTPSGIRALGNVNLSGTHNIGGGNYSCTSFNLTGATLNVQGNVNLYCSGDVTVNSTSTINTNNGGYKVQIFLTSGSGFNYSGLGTLYAAVYAPNSPANLNGGTIVGSLVCKQLSMSGSALLRYDSRWPIPVGYTPTGGGSAAGGSGTTGSIATVK